MKKEFIFLFGSGISYISDAPSIECITKSLTEEEWYKHTNSLYYLCDSTSGKIPSDDVEEIKNLIKIIKNTVDSKINYEEILHILNSIIDDINYNKVISYHSVFESISKISNRNIIELIDSTIRFIQCIVFHKLYKINKTEGLDILLELKSRNYNYNIATLNHDLVVEKYLTSFDIKYTDGLIEDAKQSSVSFSNTEFVEIYKLHGSINWRTFLDQPMKFFIKSNKPTEIITNNDSIIPDMEISKILSGTTEKPANYFSGIYKKIFIRLFEKLDTTNTLIISGYGWKDIGINQIIFDWIYEKEENKCLLLYEDDNFIKAIGLDHYKYLIETNKFIRIHKWLSYTQYEDILEYIN
jgi:hypothetical protein